MTEHEEKRRTLLSRLSRRLGYAAPALALVASGAALHAVADETGTQPAYTSGQEAPLMLAEAHQEKKPEAEAEAEGEAEGEGEGEAEAEAEGEAEGT